MSEVTREVNPQADNPFIIGKRPVDTLVSFATLIRARAVPRTTLTTTELEDLRNRNINLTPENVQLYLEKRLLRAEEARKSAGNPFRTQETETEYLYDGEDSDGSMLHQAEEIAQAKGKPLRKSELPLETGGYRKQVISGLNEERAAKVYRALTGFQNEEEVYRTVLGMIKEKKYNEASAFLLKVVRKIWPDHERRVKKHLEDDRRNQERLADQARAGISPYDTYWSKTIRQYLDWATVLAKFIDDRK